jgi:hypothetical protein
MRFPVGLQGDGVDAVDLGIETAKTIAFDPREYVKLAAAAGSATFIYGSRVYCHDPMTQNREYDFLRGWLRGTKNGACVLHDYLEENPGENELEIWRSYSLHDRVR